MYPMEQTDACVDCGTAPCSHPVDPLLVNLLDALAERAVTGEESAAHWKALALALALLVTLLLMGLIGAVA